MSWLPMYLNEDDLTELMDFLNSEKHMYSIRSMGKGKWRAVSEIDINETGRYCLFHSEAGPLPLLGSSPEEPDSEISAPFDGWCELRAGANPNQPYFGPGHPAIFWFNVRLNQDGVIGLSSFEWIGNHYAPLGNSAPEVSKKWWGRLGRWVKKRSERIPRTGDINGDKKEIWAFSGALNDIESGCPRAMNP